MKKIIRFLLVSACLCSCSGQKESIDFVTLKENEFNTKLFALPSNSITDSLKKAHDSCMGFSFDANAILVKTGDTFFIGSIVNRHSLKIVSTIGNLGLTEAQMMAKFNVITTPCYEKKILPLPLRLALGENFALQLPDVDTTINKEINDIIAASADIQMQTGSWVYLDVQNALKNVLDTIKSTTGLEYKKNLLDTSNMVLTAQESITDISFIIHTGRDMSEKLQALLKNKPSLSLHNSKFTVQLFYIDSNQFQMSFNGFTPVVGQFMKAVLN